MFKIYGCTVSASHSPCRVSHGSCRPIRGHRMTKFFLPVCCTTSAIWHWPFSTQDKATSCITTWQQNLIARHMDIEREVLEISHDELGAELARHWNLPEEIITVLRYHHTPNVAEAEAGQPLAHMIYIVEKLLPSFGVIEYVDSRH
jgi:hypothetical protein